MTRAPANLLAVRSLLLTHLDNAPGPDELDPGEVGIVGDSAHRGGYHCGSDRTVANDYSVVESPRDRAGLTLDAAGLDVGQFNVRSAGRTHTLPSFSVWCVGQCEADAADTRDIREIIYSPDGTTVRRWDRLGKRKSGDSSHRWHTHFSFFRDAIKAGRDQRPLFRRYLQHIGLLQAPTVEDDMTPEEHNWLATVHKNLTVLDGRNPIGQIYTRMAMGEDATAAKYTAAHPTLRGLGAQMAAMQTALLGAVKGLDTSSILARIDEVAAAETARDQAAVQRDAELTELVAKAQSGELAADRFVDEVARRLNEQQG
ncbi:hypothetical protein OG992_18635 [Micromonospora sp. NBC_00362]|uniref:hypothetical protein n=1 Tax=Micromonospora sp. NBC_00362 TaxID=2975975 RepID=UPI002252FD8B|nr:hypothetical protein [Micromonospora sp. NBC_00362]MCX5119206.1 hypothetical protein [Micromonospora sp. NBC_00362]